MSDDSEEVEVQTTESQKPKRPEFVNGVRVKAPEDYDFNTWGISSLKIGKDFS